MHLIKSVFYFLPAPATLPALISLPLEQSWTGDFTMQIRITGLSAQSLISYLRRRLVGNAMCPGPFSPTVTLGKVEPVEGLSFHPVEE